MAVEFRPPHFNSVTTMLSVQDATTQVKFLEKAFDAKVLYKMETPQGEIVHAEVDVLGTTMMVDCPRDSSGVQTAALYLYVEDCDTLFKSAIAAGATVIRELENLFYGDRSGIVRDPNGNTWWIATHVEDVSDEEMGRRMREMKAS